MCNKSLSILDFILEHDVDVLCITETWLTGTEKDNSVISELVPDGYSLMHNPRSSRGGGIAIIHRSAISVSPLEKIGDFATFEYMECIVKHPQSLRLCVVYRAPKHPAPQFLAEFPEILETISAYKGHVLITGDFNFHMENAEDSHATELKLLLTSFNLTQHVTQETHRRGGLLDLVITRAGDSCILSVNVEDHGFPDHFPVFIETTLKKPAAERSTVTFRRLKNIEHEALITAIQQSPLATMNTQLPLPEQVDLYNSVLGAILDKMAPEITRVITRRDNVDWYNDDIRNAKQARRRAERKWRKSHLQVDRDLYVECRQKVDDALLEAKKSHYRKLIVECEDQKQVYKIVNKLLGRAQKPNSSAELPPPEWAEILSKFFIRKIDDIRASIPDARDPTPASQPLQDCSFDNFMPVNETEIKKIINASSGKSCALDPIPTEFLKVAQNELAPVITTIVNTSLAEGVFPSCYKKALVKPLLKKRNLDPSTLKNFRPVSNLPYASKIIEKVVASQLKEYLSLNNLWEPHQSAYRCSHSTETALLHVMNDILCSLGEHHAVLFVALDLSAAFDTVDYSLLEEVLLRLGIQGKVADWFESYLRGREQRVNVNGSTSSSQQLSCGVPQGSVLGPLLFSLYSASLGKVLRGHGVRYHFFADDTQLWLPFRPENLDNAIDSMQRCLDDVILWMSHHKLKLNVEKTEFLVISSRHHASVYNLEQPINVGTVDTPPATTAVRNLGVLIDPRLSLESFVAQVCKSCYYSLHNINRIKGFVDFQTLERIIHCFISSKLDYCNSMFLGLPATLLKRLQRVQNAAARILTCTPRRDHIMPVLYQLHWLPIEARVMFKVLLLIHKVLHHNGPAYLRTLLIAESRSSRRPNQLRVPFTKSAVVYERAFSVAGPRLWNQLPLEMQQTEMTELFKKDLKTYLFKKFYNCFN